MGLIHSQQTKDMKLKVYSPLQKLEIPLVSPIDSLSNIEILSLLDIDTIIAGTGTTGDTTILTSGINTITGTTIDTGISIEYLIIGILFLIARVLDQRLNLKQDLGRELDQMNQDQGHQTDLE